MNSKIKAAVDFGPLLVFFVTYYVYGIMAATAAIMGMTLLALATSYALERKLAPMPLISGIMIAVFGSVTLILHDPIYLVLKATVFYGFAASALGIGLYLEKPFLKFVFGHAFQLPHDAWHTLAWRWIGFFLFLAGANLAVYYTMGEAFWVNFKVWGILPLIFIFTMAQMPFIMKNQIESPAESTEG